MTIRALRPGGAQQPQFLRIRWEAGHEENGNILEADLCRRHREEIALKYQSARGCGQRGQSCDFCEGREPRRV